MIIKKDGMEIKCESREEIEFLLNKFLDQKRLIIDKAIVSKKGVDRNILVFEEFKKSAEPLSIKVVHKKLFGKDTSNDGLKRIREYLLNNGVPENMFSRRGRKPGTTTLVTQHRDVTINNLAGTYGMQQERMVSVFQMLNVVGDIGVKDFEVVGFKQGNWKAFLYSTLMLAKDIDRLCGLQGHIEFKNEKLVLVKN